jgi:2-octaprenylphenol hydroxylase
MPEQYDILIIGGGMVGATVAAALGGSPLRVALVEMTEPRPFSPDDEIDLRVSAITRASQRILQAVGAWPGIEARRLSPYSQMHVWDASGSGMIHFDSRDLGEEDLGHIIENRVIQLAVLDRVREHGNIELFCPVQPGELRLEDDAVTLPLEDGRILRASLVVGADGRESRVRRTAGIHTQGWDYDHHAVVGVVSTELHHDYTAWQRFLPTGPLAFLPLHDGRSSIVWSTTPRQAAELVEMDEAAFCDRLTGAFEGRLGRVTAAGPRAAFPLRLMHAESYVRPRVALVGDAAHNIHPLAGQGVNLGLLDAATLAEVILDARRRGQDPGSMKVLRRHERWRKGDTLAVMAAMDGFKKLFGSELAPVRWARNFGLSLTNAVVPVKHLLMKRALGLGGDLPKLARGQALTGSGE